MPNTNWSNLNRLQLGRFAEYYAKMEFTSYGFDVYTSEVDDHGVDFVAKYNGIFYEVQVKALRQPTLVIRKDKVVVGDKFLICLLRFIDGSMPEVYVFPSSVWSNPNTLFVDRQYDKPGQKSKPEYGVNCSKKNLPFLTPYRIGEFVSHLIPGKINLP